MLGAGGGDERGLSGDAGIGVGTVGAVGCGAIGFGGIRVGPTGIGAGAGGGVAGFGGATGVEVGTAPTGAGVGTGTGAAAVGCIGLSSISNLKAPAEGTAGGAACNSLSIFCASAFEGSKWRIS